MKRKKTVPAEVVPKPVNDAAPVPEKDHPLYDRLFVVGFAVLLFFASLYPFKKLVLIEI